MALSFQGQSWGLSGWVDYVLAEGKVWGLSGNPKKQNIVEAKPVEAFEM